MNEHFRKYDSVVRVGHHDSVDVLKAGDTISVWEKIDGSNGSFTMVGDEILAFSRNLPLDESNNLNGFWQWTQTLDKSKIIEGVTYYGEWAVPHKVDYGENARQFYLFDVWQPMIYTHEAHETYEYADTWEVVYEAQQLGINLAPLLYVGPYKGYEHLQAMVGRSVLAVDAQKGEGIVIKNHKYRNKYGGYVWLKMVSEGFAEVKKVKAPRDLSLMSEAQRMAHECTTEARVEKAVDRLIEVRVFGEDELELSNMKSLIPIVSQTVCDDIIREEVVGDRDEEFLGDLRNRMGRTVPPLLRKVIEKAQARRMGESE